MPQQNWEYGRFLGGFGGEEKPGCALGNRALAGQRVSVGFNFFAIRSPDGGSEAWGQGLSNFTINGERVLKKTFSKRDGRQGRVEGAPEGRRALSQRTLVHRRGVVRPRARQRRGCSS